jgi:hypothetical protein
MSAVTGRSREAVMEESISAAGCKDCQHAVKDSYVSASIRNEKNKRFKNREISRLCIALRVGFNSYNVRLSLEDIKEAHGFTNEELIQHVMIDSYCE